MRIDQHLDQLEIVVETLWKEEKDIDRKLEFTEMFEVIWKCRVQIKEGLQAEVDDRLHLLGQRLNCIVEMKTTAVNSNSITSN